MKSTYRLCRTFQRVRPIVLGLLAVSSVLSFQLPATAQDIFAVDVAPRTSIRSRAQVAYRHVHEFADGKLLVLGTFRFVDGMLTDGMVRLHPDGRIDPTFTSPYPASRISGCGVTPDGRIIIAALVLMTSGLQRVVQRLLPDGSLDPAFPALDISAFSPQAVIGLHDGGAYVLSQSGPNTMRVLRVRPDGQLDATFNSAPLMGFFVNQGALGPSGQVALVSTSSVGAASVVLVSANGDVQPPLFGLPENFRARAAVFEPSGALVVSGSSTDNALPSLGLVRILPDGARDVLFSGSTPFPSGTGSHVVRLSDGTFVAAGPGSSTIPAIMHFSASGHYIDGISGTGLDGGPIAPPALFGSATGGAYVVGGFSTLDGVLVPNVARVTASFSVDAEYFVDIAAAGQVPALARLGDRILLAGGFSEIGEQHIHNLATLGADNEFGALLPYFPPGTSSARGTSDGGAVLTGSFSAPAAPGPVAIGALKINADGSLHNTFLPWVQQGAIMDAVEQSDGRLVFAGRVFAPGVLNLFRTNADGTLDSTFNQESPVSGGAGLSAVAVDTQGRIVVAGSFTTFQGMPRPGLARVLANGLVDPTFAPPVGLSGFPRYIRFLPDGSFYVAGTRSDQPPGPNALVRFNADGSLHDSQLNLPGVGVGSYELHPDGSIFIAGGSGTGSGVFRVLPSGELDPLFDAVFDLTTNSPILIDDFGRVLVGGVFSRVNGEPLEGLVRFAPVAFGVTISGPAAYELPKHSEFTLSAVVSGSRTPASFQWFLDDEPIKGATGATLTLRRIKPKDAGTYSVSATAASGTVVSTPVTLVVLHGRPAK